MPIDSCSLGPFNFVAISLTIIPDQLQLVQMTHQGCVSIAGVSRKTPVSASTFQTLSIFWSMDLVSLSSSSTGSDALSPLNLGQIKFSQLCFWTWIFLWHLTQVCGCPRGRVQCPGWRHREKHLLNNLLSAHSVLQSFPISALWLYVLFSVEKKASPCLMAGKMLVWVFLSNSICTGKLLVKGFGITIRKHCWTLLFTHQLLIQWESAQSLSSVHRFQAHLRDQPLSSSAKLPLTAWSCCLWFLLIGKEFS